MPGYRTDLGWFVTMLEQTLSRQCHVYLHRIFESNDGQLNGPESEQLRFEDVKQFFLEQVEVNEFLRNHGFPQPYFPSATDGDICIAQQETNSIFAADGLRRGCIREITGQGARVDERGNWNDAGQFYLTHTAALDQICAECQYLPVCGGGCVKERLERPKDYVKRCTPWRFTLRHELTNLLAKEIKDEETSADVGDQSG
jgi:radical SAM protein with 4Fe4S-binding SPASM domain